MPHETENVRTNDGTCPVHLFEPEAGSDVPGVIMYMDGPGIRPALFDMAERLAGGGYRVALPDLYYRSGFKVPEGKSLFGDPVLLADWKARVVPTVSNTLIMRDVPAFIDLLNARAGKPNCPIGTTGYCMGGRLSLTTAGTFPDRITAAASYHGGALATDAPDSPHLLAPQMKARVYVAGAIEDSGFDDAQKQRLEDALTNADVEHFVETYNARHGWVPADMPTHDPVAAERHWQTLLGLFGATLTIGDC
ncbi:MAG: dienelactone hydrolase family protein [Gemmatimonadota bacterium]|nr:dienelactone hydrolase family protein [Gemmatimonadota bacterium]